MASKADIDPLLPLTRVNARSNFRELLHVELCSGLQDLAAYRKIITQLYEPDAVFEYPAARVQGREDIRRFWTVFLVMRAIEKLNIYKLEIDTMFDPETLKLTVDILAWQHSGYLAWLESLLGGRKIDVLKVWSSQVVHFREDAAGHLRIQYHEERADQLIFLEGTFMLGLYLHKLDRGTPLWYLIESARSAIAWCTSVFALLIEFVLEACGVAL